MRAVALGVVVASMGVLAACGGTVVGSLDAHAESHVALGSLLSTSDLQLALSVGGSAIAASRSLSPSQVTEIEAQRLLIDLSANHAGTALGAAKGHEALEIAEANGATVLGELRVIAHGERPAALTVYGRADLQAIGALLPSTATTSPIFQGLEAGFANRWFELPPNLLSAIAARRASLASSADVSEITEAVQAYVRALSQSSKTTTEPPVNGDQVIEISGSLHTFLSESESLIDRVLAVEGVEAHLPSSQVGSATGSYAARLVLGAGDLLDQLRLTVTAEGRSLVLSVVIGHADHPITAPGDATLLPSSLFSNLLGGTNGSSSSVPLLS
jgi:hypothetical protein